MKASIDITKDNLQLLEKAYDKAVSENLTQFDFNGSELSTSYAKYAIQYMRNTLCGN